MAKLTKSETQWIERFEDEVLALYKRNDDLMYSTVNQLKMHQLEAPSDALVQAAREVREGLASKGIPSPELDNFIVDRSPFHIKKVVQELRAIVSQHGEL